MKYVIEFDLPDNDTVLNNIKTAWVGWNVWGYSGIAHAKPKQPDGKKGKWIDGRCSQCGGEAYWKRGRDVYGWQEFALELTKYCPNCGAKMEEPEDIPMEYFESGGR